MLPQYQNSINASVFLWAENRLLDKGQAYISTTSKLYYTPDTVLGSSFVSYSSPFKQWVCDSGVSGANIISQISGGGFGTLSNGQSGMMFDYNNGRVILPSTFGKTLNISGSYSFKEVNFYLANSTEEDILISNKYNLNPRFTTGQMSGISPYSLVTPAVFVNNLKYDSTPFSLGGQVESLSNISLIALTETPFQLDAILSIFEDAKYKYIPFLSIEDDPLDGYGNLKSGYNYKTVAQTRGTPGNLLYIENVQTSKISDKVQSSFILYGGVIDMDIRFARMVT